MMKASPVGALMFLRPDTTYGFGGVVYRKRIKGSQQAYVFVDADDAEKAAAKDNLVAIHKGE
jgi:hypothetical protein